MPRPLPVVRIASRDGSRASVVGLIAVDGTAGTIILACGFIALLGAGISLISRNGPPPHEEPRPPVGHYGL